MRIVFIGDIMGRSGREALQKYLPAIRQSLEPDVIIVNGENAASGRGITEKICKQFYEWGVDCITSGNHIWDQREILSYIARDPKLLRPLNYPEGTQGSGLYIHTIQDGRKICVINAMARLFMEPLEDPFRLVHETVQKVQLRRDVVAIFVDFHGETTSEKMALAHYLDGKISALVGTHTHIPTADAHILPGGTAYMSDSGMTGDYHSVIGVTTEVGIHNFVKKVPRMPLQPAAEAGMLCGAYIETDDKTGLARRIEPIRIGVGLTEYMPKV